MSKSLIKRAQQLSSILDKSLSESGGDEEDFIKAVLNNLIESQVDEAVEEQIGQLPSE